MSKATVSKATGAAADWQIRLYHASFFSQCAKTHSVTIFSRLCLAAVFAIAAGLSMIAIFVSILAAGVDTAVTWQGIAAYVTSYDPLQWLAVIPCVENQL